MHIYLAPLASLMRVLIEAYGCSLNHGEAEEFIDGLDEMGHEIIDDQDRAQAFVLFTCAVIETTERHMLKRIGELAAFPGKKLLVCGCLPNISPEKIKKIAPHAILVGTANHMSGLAHFSNGAVKPALRKSFIGILPIASGCLGTCSYCITKTARGILNSRRPNEVLKRLQGQIKNGAAEVQLCAQDTAVYGADVSSNLAELVQILSAAKGNFMMRVGMMNPASVLRDRENIFLAYEDSKVFKFLHLPVQSGSDEILGRMNRNHTVADFESVVETFRSHFPEMTLSTDIIIGFPGEKDDDFSMSLELMKRMNPDIINITRFSSRPGTKAHTMKDRVPSRIAKDRSRILTELRFSLTGEKYAAFRGRNVRALATEYRMEGTTFLRTLNYRPVVVEGEIELGRWYDVLITGNEKTHLAGKLTECS